MDEKLLVGKQEIADFLRTSTRTVQRQITEMRDCGCAWLDWHGRPPRKMWFSCASMLLRWKILKEKEKTNGG